MKETHTRQRTTDRNSAVNNLALLEALLNIIINATELTMLAIGSLIILTVIYKKNKIRSIAKNFRLSSDLAKLNIKDKFAILCGGCLMTSGPALGFCCNWLYHRLYSQSFAIIEYKAMRKNLDNLTNI
jgi:hypothetical protein